MITLNMTHVPEKKLFSDNNKIRINLIISSIIPIPIKIGNKDQECDFSNIDVRSFSFYIICLQLFTANEYLIECVL